MKMIDPGPDARTLRLDTLVKLRWLAVAGQSAAVLVVHSGLGFPLPFGLCFLVIAASAWLNVGLRVRYPVTARVPDWAAFWMQAYDIIQLAALLYLTGGLGNPFAVLLLAPVMISATVLSPRQTLGLGLLAMVAATLVAFSHRPLPWFPGEGLEMPPLYVAGIWAALLLGLNFTGIYGWRVAQEARDLATALAATELVLAREQHLTQLDGLAAAAAHELGTPLATITLVAKELHRAMPADGPHAEDMALLLGQVARCREILGKIASLGAGDNGAAPHDTMTLSHLIEEVVAPLRSFGVEIHVDLEGRGREPACRRNPGMLYGLENLIENAIDFAGSRVEISGCWDDAVVDMTIRDDGPGFASDVLARVGEPYVTSRSSERRAKGEAGGGDGAGLGLGLFIAKTLLERSGASLAFANAQSPAKGALVRISWPRLAYERVAAVAGEVAPGAPLAPTGATGGAPYGL